MGSCFSCRSSSSFDSIRVVHLNGYIENFEDPITAKQVTGNLPKHFICTMTQLLLGLKPIRPEVQLEPGCIYFLLPYSVLGPDISSGDMVALAARLTALAKRSRSCSKQVQEAVRNPITSKGYAKVVSTNCEFSPRPSRVQNSSKVRTWKPILDAIIEKSMEHRLM
ncbi:hypothetical protein IFM89_031550 [Coptis chinensis]|uniref:Uncharacterized protein n=1 Tax=Coptis chinensis TaxID=261450 RepID=A0A835IFF4_9MAGN|nr:hypothetical protein IFM89_031550 [Coptis chinensis]